MRLEELPHDQRFLGAISAVRYESLIKQDNKLDLIVVVTARLTDKLKHLNSQLKIYLLFKQYLFCFKIAQCSRSWLSAPMDPSWLTALIWPR